MSEASLTASSRVEGFNFQFPLMNGLRASKAVVELVVDGEVVGIGQKAATELAIERKVKAVNFIVLGSG